MPNNAYSYLNDPTLKKFLTYTNGTGDVFIARVINQKAVNQNAQQALVAIAVQIMNITEAQFGFSTNEDVETIKEE